LKEEELQRMKKLIFTTKTRNLIEGFTEILIGEKMNAFENE